METEVQKQISVLRSKGLEIADQKKIGIFLMMNNFDYIMDVFGRHFIEPGINTFIPGTSFDEIIALHHYDEEIRGTLLKTVLICEFRIKSVIVNTFNTAHPSSGAYLDASNFSQEDNKSVDELIKKMLKTKKDLEKQSTIGDNGNRKISLAYILNNSEYAVGKRFYDAMRNDDRKTVASWITNAFRNEYGYSEILKPKDIDALMEMLHQFRNCLAHNNPLSDFKTTANVPYLESLHRKFGILPDNSRNDLYNVFIMLQPFISNKQFAILYNAIRKRSRGLKNIKTVTINTILGSMGFPDNWHESPKMNQN